MFLSHSMPLDLLLELERFSVILKDRHNTGSGFLPRSKTALLQDVKIHLLLMLPLSVSRTL